MAVENATIEVSTVVNDKKHVRQGSVQLPTTLSEAVSLWGEEVVVKLSRQAAKTNAENLARANLRRELEGGATKHDRAISLVKSMTAEEKAKFLQELGL